MEIPVFGKILAEVVYEDRPGAYGFLFDDLKRLAVIETGMGFFLLGDKESKSNVKAFQTVGVNTDEIISLLKAAGIKTGFESVPGNHYANPIPRLDKAFSALYSDSTSE